MSVKVLHVLWSGQVFGAERILLEVSSKIPNTKTAVVCLEDDNSSSDDNYHNFLGNALLKRGIPCFLSTRSWFSFIRTIKKAIEVFRPDIIHSHDYRATIAATIVRYLSLRKNTVFQVVHIHASYPFMEKFNFKSLIGFLTLLLQRKILVVSEQVLNGWWFKDIVKDKTLIIHNPYLGKPKMSTLGEALKSKDIDLIFVGRLTPKKHPEFFGEMCSHLSNVKSAAIGSGPLEKELREKYGNKIKFLGYREDVEDWLYRSKFLVLPSEYEGFGLVLIEAIMNFCIPIVTPWKGVERIIHNGKTGFFIPRNINQASGMINDLFSKYEEVFQNFYYARYHIIGKYSLEKYISLLENLYKDLLRNDKDDGCIAY